VRWALVEAAASVIGQPGRVRAYHQRLRSRGHQIAVVAVAHKLAVLFWCLLTRHQQYAHRASLADRQEAAPARDPRRRPEHEGARSSSMAIGASPAARYARLAKATASGSATYARAGTWSVG
jgi:hypothetical protein